MAARASSRVRTNAASAFARRGLRDCRLVAERLVEPLRRSRGPCLRAATAASTPDAHLELVLERLEAALLEVEDARRLAGLRVLRLARVAELRDRADPEQRRACCARSRSASRPSPRRAAVGEGLRGVVAGRAARRAALAQRLAREEEAPETRDLLSLGCCSAGHEQNADDGQAPNGDAAWHPG